MKKGLRGPQVLLSRNDYDWIFHHPELDLLDAAHLWSMFPVHNHMRGAPDVRGSSMLALPVAVELVGRSVADPSRQKTFGRVREFRIAELLNHSLCLDQFVSATRRKGY